MKKLIFTKGTEFEQNGTDAAIIDTDNRAGKPININLYDLAEAYVSCEDYDIYQEIYDCGNNNEPDPNRPM